MMREKNSLSLSLIKDVKIKDTEEIKTYEGIRNLIYSIKPKRSLPSIMRDAYYYSFLVTKSILTKPSAPEDLLEKYKELKEEYNNKNYVSLIILASTIILSLAMKNFIIFTIGFIISFVSFITSQKEREEIEKEVIWVLI